MIPSIMYCRDTLRREHVGFSPAPHTAPAGAEHGACGHISVIVNNQMIVFGGDRNLFRVVPQLANTQAKALQKLMPAKKELTDAESKVSLAASR